MEKIKRITLSCLILFLMLGVVSTFSYTTFAGEGGGEGGSGSEFTTLIQDFSSATGNEKANNATKNVVGAMAVIVRIVGMGVAVIMLIVLAMKYMIAAPGDKADIKKHAIVFVVGAIVLFAATEILEIIAEFAGNFSSDTAAG